jgi:predicted alpha/beta hydrolase
MPTTDDPAVRSTAVVLASTDGYPLHATLYEPPQGASAAVLINSAVGVKQSFYRRFARFLASEGFEVVTYDYRGVGLSAPPRLRGFPARMRDWGQKDFPAVLDWLLEHRAGRPVFAVGHSVGGQIVGLAPNNDAIEAFVAVCSQHTWWRHWPPAQQPRLFVLWYLLIPGLSHALGYFPSSRFGLGEDLPKGVALEWAQWARSPQHVASAIGEHVRPGYAQYAGGILAYSFADDTFAPPSAVDRLLEVYSSADRTHRHVRPRDVGRPIGHFGYFREDFRESLWRPTVEWLQSRLPTAGR